MPGGVCSSVACPGHGRPSSQPWGSLRGWVVSQPGARRPASGPGASPTPISVHPTPRRAAGRRVFGRVSVRGGSFLQITPDPFPGGSPSRSPHPSSHCFPSAGPPPMLPELTCLLPDAQSLPTPARCFVGTRGVVFLPPSQPQSLLSKLHIPCGDPQHRRSSPAGPCVPVPSVPAPGSVLSPAPPPRLRPAGASTAALAALIPTTEVSGLSSPTPQPCLAGDTHGLRSLCDLSGGHLGVLSGRPAPGLEFSHR